MGALARAPFSSEFVLLALFILHLFFCFNLHLVASLQSLMTGLIAFFFLYVVCISEKNPLDLRKMMPSGLCGTTRETNITEITFLLNLEAYLNHPTVKYISTMPALFFFSQCKEI